ncbi:MAG: DUF6328 family protein [Gemmatimonadota bacterium]
MSKPYLSGIGVLALPPGAAAVLPAPARVPGAHDKPTWPDAVSTPGRPGETEAERDDRNLTELLQELRVAGLGVQMIFGFLLSLPFTARFATLGPAQRSLYVATLVLAAVSTALLVGPVAYHRLVFRRHLKHHLIRAANVMAVCGLAAVGLTVSAAVLLVLSYVARGLPAIVLSAAVVCLFGTLWFAVPLARRWSSREEQ